MITMLVCDVCRCDGDVRPVEVSISGNRMPLWDWADKRKISLWTKDLCKACADKLRSEVTKLSK